MQETLIDTHALIVVLHIGVLKKLTHHQATAEATLYQNQIVLDQIIRIMYARTKAYQEELKTCYVRRKPQIDKTLMTLL